MPPVRISIMAHPKYRPPRCRRVFLLLATILLLTFGCLWFLPPSRSSTIYPSPRPYTWNNPKGSIHPSFLSSDRQCVCSPQPQQARPKGSVAESDSVHQTVNATTAVTAMTVLDLDANHANGSNIAMDDDDEDASRVPKQRVLILTPMMDAFSSLDRYFELLQAIDYPKSLISLGFLVSTRNRLSTIIKTGSSGDGDGTDPTLSRLQTHLSRILADPKQAYRHITLLTEAAQDQQRVLSHKDRHEYQHQFYRRKTMAKCRNRLLTSCLRDESWVFWLDVDLEYYSPKALRRLMKFDKDIVAPNCFRRGVKNWDWKRVVDKVKTWVGRGPGPEEEQKQHDQDDDADDGDGIQTYDMNNWQETKESKAIQRDMDNEDEVLFEGYNDHPTFRQSMTALKGKKKQRQQPGGTGPAVYSSLEVDSEPNNVSSIRDADADQLVPLDVVGGTCTLVKAYVHRQGVYFPTLAVDHQIETEGFAKMAAREGFEVYGVPDMIVYHE